MAKMYKQSVKDRMAESRGMERYETKRKMKKPSDPFDGYHKDRKRFEDPRAMLTEDTSAPANMPPAVKMAMYPKSRYINSSVDDSWKNLDFENDISVGKIDRNMPDKAYDY
jgi:hypothetical protein